MSRPIWVVKLIKKGFPRLTTAARLTRLPVLGRLSKRMLFEGDEIVVMPRKTTVHLGENVDGGEAVIVPLKVVEHFIEKANYHWIMDGCICRDASNCGQYPVDLGCLFMGEAAMRINPRLGHRVTRGEAVEHMRRCHEAGLFHVIGRNKLDSVWLKAKPGNRLLTVCNCCPCCCVWRVLPELSVDISSSVGKMPGVEVSVGEDCAGCETCVETCFAGAISMVGGRAVIGGQCRGCGHCVEACPNAAVEISIDEELALRGTVARITPLVDVS